MDKGRARQALAEQQAGMVTLSDSNQHVSRRCLAARNNADATRIQFHILLPPTKFDRMHALANIKLDANHYDKFALRNQSELAALLVVL